MRCAALILLLAASRSAFAAEADDTPHRDPGPPDIDEILDKPLTESEYRKQSACISMRAVKDVEILDDTLVLFHGKRGELWLNQLSSQCYGLDQDVFLRFRVRAGRYCRLDSFRGMPRFGLISVTPDCRLGYFETVDEVQVDALRTAVDERRKIDDMARETRRQARRRQTRGD